MAEHGINLNSSVYYTGRYWNDLSQVRDVINERISGSSSCSWETHFARRAGRVFKCALMLNCGNGWVERSLIQSGLIEQSVGIDCSESLLEQARQEADQHGLLASYVCMDVNTAPFPRRDYDLVVNVGAAHHIAYIDRVFRRLAELLPEDGWFVSFDYVGPHRNQYRTDAWESAWALNRAMPKSLRQDLQYPHLPTMLHDDPTEAIHSELLVDTFNRYFVGEEFVPLGGALAYPLLTHNARLFEAPDGPERAFWVGQVLEADAAFLEAHPDSSLFAYFSGRPRKAVLDEKDQLVQWTQEEENREARAIESGGEYYPRGALQTESIERVRRDEEIAQLRTALTGAEDELASIRAGLGYALAARISTSRLAAAVRARPAVRHLVSRLIRR